MDIISSHPGPDESSHAFRNGEVKEGKSLWQFPYRSWFGSGRQFGQWHAVRLIRYLSSGIHFVEAPRAGSGLVFCAPCLALSFPKEPICDDGCDDDSSDCPNDPSDDGSGVRVRAAAGRIAGVGRCVGRWSVGEWSGGAGRGRRSGG